MKFELAITTKSGPCIGDIPVLGGLLEAEGRTPGSRVRSRDRAAAVYARKSTEQNVADDEKSVRRQIELAVTCAKEHGFTVPAEHIYFDDAISGAEFDRRPGLMRLLNAIGRRAPICHALFGGQGPAGGASSSRPTTS